MDLLLHNLRTGGTRHNDWSVAREAADEIERLRAALAEIWDKYQAGGLNAPTTALSGTLAYIAKDALAHNAQVQASGAGLCAASPGTES